MPRLNSGKGVTPEAKKTVLLLILNTLVSFAVYFGCVELGFSPIFFVYVGLTAALLIVYVIYNRGFVLKGATPEMLSDELSPAEKQVMLDRAAARLRDSRWLLTIIIPLVLAMLVDAVYLFFLEDLLISLGLEL
ncbi:MAG: hypothetical protein IIX15_04465 [Clostridia bacterium]|nr:hypothetical protein [Clostridia bacterium]